MLTLNAPSRRHAHWIGQAVPEIESAVVTLAGEIALHASHLASDLKAVSEGRPQDVPVAGVMSRGDVLCAVVMAAQELDAATLSVLEAPLGVYLTPAAAASFESSRILLGEIAATAPACGPLQPESRAVAEDYIETHLGGVSETMHAAERLVVLEEQVYINVYEPNEVSSPNLWAACGIAVIALLIVAV